MTLQEAIEIKRTFSFKNGHLMTNQEALADDLSIEALKAISYWNKHQHPRHQFHLPGETKE